MPNNNNNNNNNNQKNMNEIRIIIRYCLPWGNFSTQAIRINDECDVSELSTKIQEKFHLLPKQQSIKFKRDGYTIKVLPGWNLKFYDIKDKDILYLEKIENHNEDNNNQVNHVADGYKIQGSYYARLGILSTVNDEDEPDEDEKTTSRRFTWRRDLGYSYKDSDLISEEDREDIRSRKNTLRIDFGLKDDVEKLIKYTKSGNHQKILEIFNSTTSFSNSQNLDMKKIKKLIDEKGSAGWNALHFAVFFGHQNLVKDFLEKNADPNINTTDEWIPLQLAIQKNQLEVAKMLLRQPGIKVNYITIRGSSLHIASKTGKVEFVSLLVASNADLSLKNEEGETPYDIAYNQEIRTILEKAAIDFDNKQQHLDTFKPPKPPLIKGWMLKKSGPFQLSLKRRFFVINPDEGTFIRYRKLEDYPNKPIEVIPLKDIISVKRISQSWLDKKEFYYLELQYRSRYIFATKSEDAINKWVKFIYQAVAYAIYVEELVKDPLFIANKKDNQEGNQVLEIIDNQDQTTNNITTSQTTKPEQNFNIASTSSGGGKSLDDGSPRSRKSGEGEIVFNINGSKFALEDLNSKGKDFQDLGMILDQKVNFQSFDILKVLGSGAFGKVYKVKKRDTGKIYAMKALKKRQLMMKNQLKYAITEFNVLKNSNHPFILGLHYTFQTANYLYLVLDYCPGGDLSLHLAQQVVLDENQARFYAAELLLAIEYLHSYNVIYRDLKPENILIAQDGHIKLADFGLAKEGIRDDATTNSFCGSPAYLSPEMIKNKRVGKAADIYGMGTVIYEMLVGQSPFYCDNIPKMYGDIRKAKLTFPKYISETAKNFITKLLNRDPIERLGVKDKNELKNDPFFKGIDWKKVLNKEYKPPIVEDLEDMDDNNVLPSKVLLKDEDYEENKPKLNKVKNFTFVRTDQQ